jgi:hypothetical protein
MSMEAGAEAVDLARGLGDDQVLVAALHGAHTSLLNVSHLKERLVVSREVIDVSRTVGDRENTLRGLQSRIFDLIQAARVDEAKACLVELKQIADEIRQPFFTHFWMGWSASFAQMPAR